MSLETRLDHAEGSLGPVSAVVRWFKDAHAFGSVKAYADHEASLPDDARAEPQIFRQAQSYGERSSDAGPSGDAKAAGVRAARDALFRYRLALMTEVNLAANLPILAQARDDLLADQKAFVEAEELRFLLEPGAHADLFGWLAAMEAGHPIREVEYVLDLFTLVEEHAIVEHRYFDGHSFLFPGTVALQEDLLATLPIFAAAVEPATGDRRSGVDSGEDPEPSAPRLAALKEEAHTPARKLALQIVNAVRVDTLLMLGEVEKAYTLEQAVAGTDAGPVPRLVVPVIRAMRPRRGR